MLVLFVLVTQGVLDSEQLEDRRHARVAQDLLLLVCKNLVLEIMEHDSVPLVVLKRVKVLPLQPFQLDPHFVLEQLQLIDLLSRHDLHLVHGLSVDEHALSKLAVRCFQTLQTFLKFIKLLFHLPVDFQKLLVEHVLTHSFHAFLLSFNLAFPRIECLLIVFVELINQELNLNL